MDIISVVSTFHSMLDSILLFVFVIFLIKPIALELQAIKLHAVPSYFVCVVIDRRK